MKKFSRYFWTMMVLAGASTYCALAVPSATGSAILFVVAFIFWYAGIMAPDNEKYKS